MKRHWICFPVALVLAACSNDEAEIDTLNPYEYITFGAPGVTVAARDALTAFPEGGAFQVLGYLKSYSFSGGVMQDVLDDNSVTTQWETKAAVTPPSVFGGDVVNRTGVTVTYENGYCTYVPLTRWNENANAYYSFYYYYPASGGFFNTDFDNIAGDNIVGLPRLIYTMPFSGGDSSTSREMSSVPDAMYGFSEDVTQGNGTVTPTFHHLLAGLRMQVNNYSAVADVTVNSIRVYSSNFRQNITLNNDFTTTMGGQTFGGSFQFVDQAITVPKVEGDAENANGNSESIDKTLLLVPYSSASGVYFGDDTTVEISYTFGGAVTNKTNSLAFGLSINPGVIYTLHLNFVGSDLVLEFIVDNNQQWENGNEGTSDDSNNNENITFE